MFRLRNLRDNKKFKVVEYNCKQNFIIFAQRYFKDFDIRSIELMMLDVKSILR